MKKSNKIILAIIVLIIVAGFVGWLIGRSPKPANNAGSGTGTSNSATSTDPDSLVSYMLPGGWSQSSCPNSGSVEYVIPAGATLNCSVDPSAPIKIYDSGQSPTDCSQLTPTSNQGIKKHVCISLYIGGHKSLKASTEYSSNSSYKTDTTISDYYINTGRGVVALEYTYTSANDYQAGFDQLAMSVQVKS